jgi:2-polyprenyl-3-methyl-5-hydroxy-6-metoxy-1,4-benzoquinol methylase
MSQKLAKVKQTVRDRLAKSGIAIVRTEPRGKATEIFYTEDELATLDRDLDALGLNSTDYEIWTSPQAVRTYLNPERINFYHTLIDVALASGVELEGRTVLDVGTCSGYLLRIIGAMFGTTHLAGTDYYEECVRLSEGLVPGAKIFRAAVADLAESDETYDVIFCTEVLEHILDTETPIPTMLDRISPGGALVVTVPNGTYDFTPAMTSEDGTSFVGHVNFWSERSWDFYIDRIAGDYRSKTGTLTSSYDKDCLFAVIFKD